MLQVGLEYNPAAAEVHPIGTLFLSTETEVRPAVFLGLSTDRIGSPEGTSTYYATVAKYLPPLRSSLYATAGYSEWDEEMKFPFGANLDLGGGFSLQPMYDGHRSHLMAQYAAERWAVSAIAVWLEKAGLAVSFGF